MANYGVSMSDTLAMITAANTTLQDSSRVGNGLKTIGVNLAGIKTSAKDGTLELNKTAKGLKEIAGIDVFADKKKGELKNMTQILDELSSKWKDFTDEQRAGISEAISGKQQAAVFQSLMSNYKIFKQAQSELNQGKMFGSMAAENEKYVQSISGQLNRLKETWVGIFNDLF
ncbi:phage tail tape measure protein, partial [Romboutsia sp.]|uniref:phage tail tape measure protein n=1 Tax=Romboutsia sp. TaxID=1965302 RepID=UPI002D11D695